MPKSYVDGLERAAEIAESATAMARLCGQCGCVEESGVQIARMIRAEIDREDTPPRGAVLCTLCGSPISPR